MFMLILCKFRTYVKLFYDYGEIKFHTSGTINRNAPASINSANLPFHSATRT